MTIPNRLPVADLVSLFTAAIVAGLAILFVFGVVAVTYADPLCWRYSILC